MKSCEGVCISSLHVIWYAVSLLKTDGEQHGVRISVCQLNKDTSTFIDCKREGRRVSFVVVAIVVACFGASVYLVNNL